jgi:hypothetical protein
MDVGDQLVRIGGDHRKGPNPFARSWLFFGSNNLVVAGSEQENWAAYHREINRASERAWMQPKGI